MKPTRRTSIVNIRNPRCGAAIPSQWTLTGLGIGLIPEFLVQPELKRHELVNVLPQWSSLPILLTRFIPAVNTFPKKSRFF